MAALLKNQNEFARLQIFTAVFLQYTGVGIIPCELEDHANLRTFKNTTIYVHQTYIFAENMSSPNKRASQQGAEGTVLHEDDGLFPLDIMLV